MDIPQVTAVDPKPEILRSCAAALCAAARVALRHSRELDDDRRDMLLAHIETTAERLRLALPA
jgi:hypothetical protein